MKLKAILTSTKTVVELEEEDHQEVRLPASWLRAGTLFVPTRLEELYVVSETSGNRHVSYKIVLTGPVVNKDGSLHKTNTGQQVFGGLGGHPLEELPARFRGYITLEMETPNA